MGRQYIGSAMTAVTVLISVATLLSGWASGNLAAMMQRIGQQWEQIAGTVLYDSGAAIAGSIQLVRAFDELSTEMRLNSDMRRSLAETRAALVALQRLLHDERREEAWAQRLTVERLCDQCHQEYRLADIMRRMMDEYNQIADAFVRGNYERVVDGLHVLRGQTEWFRRWITPTETTFHQESQRLLDLAGAASRAAAARNRAQTQQLLQELIDSCAVCHTAYRDTAHWRELAKRY